MFFSNGVDLLRMSRLEKSLQNPRFLSHVYGQNELALYNEKKQPIAFLAGNFCGKEAFGKALGLGVRGFSLKDVEILRDDLGKPYFCLSGRAKDIVEERKLSLEISISHEKEYAIAFVTAWSTDE